MISLFDFVHFRRILKFSLLIQIVLCITFALLQMPHFLKIIQGIQFRFSNITIILLLRTLEWMSFLTLVSMIFASWWVLSEDLQNGALIFLIQLMKNTKELIHSTIILSVIYAGLFIFLQGWCVPLGTLYLKQILVNIAREKFIASIQPKHIVNLKDWSCCIKSRKANELEGILLNQKKPSISLVIKKAKLNNEQAYVNMEFKDGIGKINLPSKKFMIHFEHGDLMVPMTRLKIKGGKKHQTLFQLRSTSEKLKRILIAFSTLLMPFWLLVILLGRFFQKILASIAFIFLIFTSLEILVFQVGTYLFACLIIYYLYRKVDA